MVKSIPKINVIIPIIITASLSVMKNMSMKKYLKKLNVCINSNIDYRIYMYQSLYIE